MKTSSILRRFRKISRRFLKTEQPEHFLTEFLLFTTLLGVSAWALVYLAGVMSVALAA